MSVANVLIRTAGGGDLGWEHVLRTVSLEEHLRRRWPEVRVTVVAEGDDLVLDHLYGRVRDLVSMPADADLGVEMSARRLRDAADLVVFDLPVADPARRDAWLEGTRHLLVREDLSELNGEGKSVAYRLWSPHDRAEKIAAGAENALVDPSLTSWARDRKPADIPPSHLLVSLDHGRHEQAELVCAEALRNQCQQWERITFVTRFGVSANHRNALSRALPNARILPGTPRLPELLASADLALVAGATLRHELACVGTPGVLVSLTRGDCAGASRFAEGGSVDYVGALEAVSDSEISEAVQELRHSEQRLVTQAMKGPRYVDGGGFPRVLESLLPDRTHEAAM